MQEQEKFKSKFTGRRAQSKKDFSAIKVQRERFGMPDYTPVPPDPGGVPAGDVIMRLCRKLETSTDFAVLRAIQADWPDLAGPVLSKHAWPARLEHNTLTLCVKNSTWLNEISRVEGPLLLRRLRADDARRFEAVKKFRLIVDAETVNREGGESASR